MHPVDTETARELMRQALDAVDVAELAAVAVDLDDKSAQFVRALEPAGLPTLDRAPLEAVLARVFAVRGKARDALQAIPVAAWRDPIANLLDGPGDPGDRLQGFAGWLDGASPAALPDNLKADLGSELLRFGRPDAHWLWSRWMWDPRTRTGSLPLLTSAGLDLRGSSLGDTYRRVGRAIALVEGQRSEVGFDRLGQGRFTTEVFLAAVYVVYAYTVLKLRMTREFNKVMPELPEFCRRLLGVHRRAPAR